MNLSEIFEGLDIGEEVWKIFNKITVATLKADREVAIEDYEKVTSGVKVFAYVVDDPEEDAFQLSRRIEAYDILLGDYDLTHEPYAFNDEVWYAQEEE